MKRLHLLIAVCILNLLLSCQNGKSGAEESGLKFAYIAKQRDQSFHEGIVNGIKKEMAKKHVEVDIFAAKNQHDIETQRKLILEFAKNKKYDGIMICPNDSEALTKDIAELDNAGIPFLFVDTPLVSNEVTQSFKNYCGFVGTDNVAAGRMALNYIVEHLSGGNILMMRGIHEHRSSSDRELGFMDEIKKHPNFKTLKFLNGDWKTDLAYQNFSKFMETNSEQIDAVFAYNDHMALGISQYYDEHKDLKRPIIVGVDGTVVGQKGLLENKINAIVVQATELMGIDGLNRIIECKNEPKPRREVTVSTPVTLLTATTALQRTEKGN